MTQVHSLSLRLTPVHKFSASRNEETVWETKCSNLFLRGNGQLFALTAPDLRIPGIPDGVLQQVISQVRTANVWWPPLSPHRFFAAWQVEAPFSAVSLFDGRFNWPSLWLAAWLTPCRASPLLAYGFTGANPHCCKRFSQPRISVWFAARRCRPSPSHAYKWAHVPWVADGSTCRIRPIQPFIFPGKIHLTNNRETLSLLLHITLEERCSSTTSNTTRWCRLEHVCPYSWWWSPMCHLEIQEFLAYWVGFFLTNLQGAET